MPDVPVFFATTDGHTRRIAERLAERLRTHGFDSAPVDMGDRDALPTWRNVRGAVLCAPLRLGRFNRDARAFASRWRDPLTAVPSLFVAVSLSAASDDPGEREAARDLAKRFVVESGWTPSSVATVAGALAYTRYNPLVRWMMRRIAAKEGGPTDTSRDHVLTDWATVDALADGLAGQMLASGESDGVPLLRKRA